MAKKGKNQGKNKGKKVGLAVNEKVKDDETTTSTIPTEPSASRDSESKEYKREEDFHDKVKVVARECSRSPKADKYGFDNEATIEAKSDTDLSPAPKGVSPASIVAGSRNIVDDSKEEFKEESDEDINTDSEYLDSDEILLMLRVSRESESELEEAFLEATGTESDVYRGFFHASVGKLSKRLPKDYFEGFASDHEMPPVECWKGKVCRVRSPDNQKKKPCFFTVELDDTLADYLRNVAKSAKAYGIEPYGIEKNTNYAHITMFKYARFGGNIPRTLSEFEVKFCSLEITIPGKPYEKPYKLDRNYRNYEIRRRVWHVEPNE
jgi:hypothetical protein